MSLPLAISPQDLSYVLLRCMQLRYLSFVGTCHLAETVLDDNILVDNSSLTIYGPYLELPVLDMNILRLDESSSSTFLLLIEEDR